MRTVAILGAGNMGTALAQIIAGNGHSVRLWSIETDVLEEIRDHHLNTKYLPGLTLHERITPYWTLQESLAEAWLVLFSVPSRVVRSWRVRPGRYFVLRWWSRISSRTSVSMLQRRTECPLPAMIWARAAAPSTWG